MGEEGKKVFSQNEIKCWDSLFVLFALVEAPHQFRCLVTLAAVCGLADISQSPPCR